MLGQKRVLLVCERDSPLLVAGFCSFALLGHEAREEAQHEPQMVVGLAVQPLDLQAMAPVSRPHGDDVLAEHVAVRLHVEGFQARRLGCTQTDEQAQPFATQLVDRLGECGAFREERSRIDPIGLVGAAGHLGRTPGISAPPVQKAQALSHVLAVFAERSAGELATRSLLGHRCDIRLNVQQLGGDGETHFGPC